MRVPWNAPVQLHRALGLPYTWDNAGHTPIRHEGVQAAVVLLRAWTDAAIGDSTSPIARRVAESSLGSSEARVEALTAEVERLRRRCAALEHGRALQVAETVRVGVERDAAEAEVERLRNDLRGGPTHEQVWELNQEVERLRVVVGAAREHLGCGIDDMTFELAVQRYDDSTYAAPLSPPADGPGVYEVTVEARVRVIGADRRFAELRARSIVGSSFAAGEPETDRLAVVRVTKVDGPEFAPAPGARMPPVSAPEFNPESREPFAINVDDAAPDPNVVVIDASGEPGDDVAVAETTEPDNSPVVGGMTESIGHSTAYVDAEFAEEPVNRSTTYVVNPPRE